MPSSKCLGNENCNIDPTAARIGNIFKLKLTAENFLKLLIVIFCLYSIAILIIEYSAYVLLKINDLFKIVSERLHFYIFIYLYRLLDNLTVRIVYIYLFIFIVLNLCVVYHVAWLLLIS